MNLKRQYRSENAARDTASALTMTAHKNGPISWKLNFDARIGEIREFQSSKCSGILSIVFSFHERWGETIDSRKFSFSFGIRVNAYFSIYFFYYEIESVRLWFVIFTCIESVNSLIKNQNSIEWVSQRMGNWAPAACEAENPELIFSLSLSLFLEEIWLSISVIPMIHSSR